MTTIAKKPPKFNNAPPGCLWCPKCKQFFQIRDALRLGHLGCGETNIDMTTTIVKKPPSPDEERFALIDQFECLIEVIGDGDTESALEWLEAAIRNLEKT